VVAANRRLSAEPIKRTAARTLRYVVHAAYDGLDRWQTNADSLVPPRGINPNISFTPRRGAYAADFIASGNSIADMLVSYVGLKSSWSVLDIGCGIGRVARALTTILAPPGEYRGFDVDPKAVAWCRRAYGPHANFTFSYAPVGYRNVRGHAPIRGEEYLFPYPDASFDLAFSVSVYTHLSRTVIDHYLAETSRVLRPGGVCVNTFFVIDEHAVGAMHSGRADRSYIEQPGGEYLFDPDNPNLGIGFTPDVIDTLHARHGLKIVPPVRFGTWSGRRVESFVYQDVVIALKDSVAESDGSPAA
jgi:SAM-dependent methyltransferase